MNIRNVVKLTDVTKVFKHVKEVALERNPMYVKNTVKHLLVALIFGNMEELILERTL